MMEYPPATDSSVAESMVIEGLEILVSTIDGERQARQVLEQLSHTWWALHQIFVYLVGVIGMKLAFLDLI